MHSIRTKITLITGAAIIVAVTVATVFGITSIKKLGQSSSEKILLLLCETGEKNLDSYFESIEQSVGMVSSYAEEDLESTDLKDIQAHIDRVNSIFARVATQTNGVLTYYYRIDPSVSEKSKGFWFVDMDGNGFEEHEVTDISSYDTSDTSNLVWYTVPKSTGSPVWLPPYVTENLDVLVLSYNVPVYQNDTFVGVIGIEIDYTTMADQVNNIKLYDNGYAFINDENGDIIYHPYIDVSTLTEKNKPNVPDGLISDKALVRYTYDGTEKVGACKELSNGMRLNVVVPVSEIDGNWKGLISKVLVVAALVLFVFMLITLRFADSITKPLVALTKAAKQVRDGKYDVEIKAGGKDEVGVLSETFSQLTARIRDDMNELNALNEQLKEDNLILEAATTRDELTEVRNRACFRRDYVSFDDKELNLVLIDLDDFKKINDVYGLPAGDALLKETGKALTDCINSEYIYRYAGDEFLFIVPDGKEEELKIMLDALKERLAGMKVGDKDVPVRFSAGYVYGRTLLQDDLRLMIHQAEVMLYKAKESGKNAFMGNEYDRTFALNIKQNGEEVFLRG